MLIKCLQYACLIWSHLEVKHRRTSNDLCNLILRCACVFWNVFTCFTWSFWLKYIYGMSLKLIRFYLKKKIWVRLPRGCEKGRQGGLKILWKHPCKFKTTTKERRSVVMVTPRFGEAYPTLILGAKSSKWISSDLQQVW